MYNKDTRRKLWIGKFAFPEVNTKTTKLMAAQKQVHYFRFPEGEVELRKFCYKSKRHAFSVRIGYNKQYDVLVVVEGSLQYYQNDWISEFVV